MICRQKTSLNLIHRYIEAYIMYFGPFRVLLELAEMYAILDVYLCITHRSNLLDVGINPLIVF